MKIQMKAILSALTLGGGLLFAPSLHAQVIFTIENPGVQATTVPGAITETFDSLPLGNLGTYVSPIGTFGPGGNVHAANIYGGAYGSDYFAVGSESGTYAETLTLNGPQDYFGMWWSAGDRGNVLKFYDGATLVDTVYTSTLFPYLNPAYYGNPNNGGDAGEPFVYLDFTTTGTTQITSVVFDETLRGAGFEMDNLSVFGQPIPPPGHRIPDASETGLLLLMAGASLLGYRQCRC